MYVFIWSCILFFIYFSQTLNGLPPGALILDILANQKTPFHHAIILNKLDIVELFFSYELDVNQPLLDPSGFSYTPLQYACSQDYLEMVKILLNNGFQDLENIAQIESIQSGKEKVCQILLDHRKCRFQNTVFTREYYFTSWETSQLRNLRLNFAIKKLNTVSGISCSTVKVALCLPSSFSSLNHLWFCFQI